MSKRFKSEICAYCGAGSETADHVFARTFFPKHLRGDLPQVAACTPCNREKSKLEHYLATVLPFGGNHPLSPAMLEQSVPPRLARNQKLHRKLQERQQTVQWQEDGRVQSSFGVPYDHDQLIAYLGFVARGLARAHWSCTIRADYAVSSGLVTRGQDAILRRFFVGRSAGYARGSLGAGLILYEGQQALDNPSITMWRFLLYGGLIFSDDEQVLDIPRDLWTVTARQPIPGLISLRLASHADAGTD